MSKIEKARELIESYGFSKTDNNKSYKQYEKEYEVKISNYSYQTRKVVVEIALYYDEYDLDYAEIDVNDVGIDNCSDLEDMKCIQDALTQAIDEFEELQGEIDDLEGE